MRRLLLLRHAKSNWDQATLADHDRPLAPRGHRAGETLREHLAALGTRVDVVWCSSARRTVETLEWVQLALDDDTAVEIDSDLYGATSDELLHRIRALPADVGTAMFIGHNPGIGQLAATLTGTGDASERAAMATKYPTAALTRLTFDSTWAGVQAGAGTLEEFWTPR